MDAEFRSYYRKTFDRIIFDQNGHLTEGHLTVKGHLTERSFNRKAHLTEKII
jgi:hypothetical protein